MRTKTMKAEYFRNHEKLSDYMIKQAENGFYTVAALFYDDAMKLVRELLRYDDVVVEALEILPEEYNGYDKEYYVSVTEDLIVSAEPAYRDGKYLYADGEITLLEGSISSEILKYVGIQSSIEITIGNSYDYEYEDDDLCDECCHCLGECDDDEFYDVEYFETPNGNVARITADADTFLSHLFG